MTMNSTELTVQRDKVVDLFAKNKPELRKLVSSDEMADRVIRTTMNALMRNPQLYECKPSSVVQACMLAAADGLVIDGREAALVIYKDQAQLIPMFRGLLKLAHNTGLVASINVKAVYAKEIEQDRFDYEDGSEIKITHRPIIIGDRGDVVAVYAIAKMTNNGVYHEIMTKDEIEAIRKRSRSGQNGPWATDWTQMSFKTVLKRLCKRLPFSGTRLDQAMAEEDDAFFDEGETIEGEATPAHAASKPRRESVAERVNQAAAAKQAPLPSHDPVTGEIDGPEPGSFEPDMEDVF